MTHWRHSGRWRPCWWGSKSPRFPGVSVGKSRWKRGARRTWLTLPDLLVTASFLLLVVGVFVAPIAGAVAPELAAKLLGVAMLVFAASPFVLAGHFNLYRDWDRTKSRPQVTGQELSGCHRRNPASGSRIVLDTCLSVGTSARVAIGRGVHRRRVCESRWCRSRSTASSRLDSRTSPSGSCHHCTGSTGAPKAPCRTARDLGGFAGHFNQVCLAHQLAPLSRNSPQSSISLRRSSSRSERK